MTTFDVVYNYQHSLLPQWFYTHKEKFIALILHAPGTAYRILDDGFQRAGLPNPYAESDFKAAPSRLEDGTMVIQIDFPKPEREPLCVRSYLFFDHMFEKPLYFCVEKAGTDDTQASLCAWTSRGLHVSYGPCVPDGEDDFTACVRAYRGKTNT